MAAAVMPDPVAIVAARIAGHRTTGRVSRPTGAHVVADASDRLIATYALADLREHGLEVVRFARGADPRPLHGCTVERWPGDDTHLREGITWLVWGVWP